MATEPKEIVLRDDVTIGSTLSHAGAGGLRRRHVVRVGTPVAPKIWVDRVPAQSRGDVRWIEYSSGEVIMRYHLVLWWPCREIIGLPIVAEYAEALQVAPNTITVAAMWVARADERISDAIRCASLELLAGTDRVPTIAFVAQSVEAPNQFEAVEGVVVRVIPVGWCPRRAAVVV